MILAAVRLSFIAPEINYNYSVFHLCQSNSLSVSDIDFVVNFYVYIIGMETPTVEEEFLKNPELKKQDLDALRTWYTDLGSNIPDIPEKLLILFLHSCYYDLDKTKKCIVRYYDLRANSADFFDDRDINREELQKTMSVLRYCIFPAKDPNGYCIIFHKLKIYEPSEYNFKDGVKVLGMTMDTALHLNGTLPGIIMMFDMEGVRLAHLLRVSMFALRRFFQYIQEGNPVRLKAIHIVNTNPLIDKILFLIKPFAYKELLELVHFHTGNNSSLYQYIPKNCLPADYGGEHDSIDVLHEKHAKLLEELKPYFAEEEEYRKLKK